MTARFVEGEKIDVGYDGQRCIHARHCVLGRPEVFEANTPGEWIHPDAVHPDAIVKIVEICPSGALTYRRKDGSAQELPPPVNVVRVRENGPLAFHGELEIAGEAMLRATLCRCGASKRKPFCDRSHAKIGFAASGEPASKEAPALTVRDGPVKITPQTNGCLKVEGNLEIVSGTGRRIEQTTRAFLCRCGQSQNKPFCDGSHKVAGFTA